MVSEEMYRLGTKKSTIRSIFEYGRQRTAEVGAENVFDFSLGNPNVSAPDFIRDAAVDILMHNDPIEVHGYTIAPGKPEVRETIAADLSKRLDMRVAGKNLFMTAGAAASVTIVFKALCEVGDEFVTFRSISMLLSMLLRPRPRRSLSIRRIIRAALSTTRRRSLD